MAIDIRLATPADAALLANPVDDLFDAATDPELVAAFLADPRHHMAIACDGPLIGFVSGVHYIHPDKPAQMFLNEVSVAEGWQRRGIATDLMRHMLDHASRLGCTEAWVLADPTEAALGFYESLGADRTGRHFAMFTFALGD